MKILFNFTLMEMTVRELASFLGGEIEGDPDVQLRKPSKIEEGEPGSITFLSNPKYEPFIYTTNASAVLVNNDFKPTSSIRATLIRVPDVYGAIGQLLQAFDGSNGQTVHVVSADAFIHDSAELGKNVRVDSAAVISANAKVGDGSVITSQVFVGENVEIGKNTLLFPGVRILKNCKVGDNCIIHSNAVIGSDGFGFNPDKEGRFQKIPQIGNVEIGSDVEIGANTVIDRATMGSTVIADGVKMDNLIQIAHNVVIGANTVIAAQVGIAGSSKIGKNCMLGGQVGIAGHITLPDNTTIAAQSGVNTPPKGEGAVLFGSPAFLYKDFLKSYVGFKKLPDLMKKIEELEKELGELRREGQ
jgi:UDP-3-O-[3-hydroxymyristoyl] glucosamine N-acyltransferase